jgi:putative phosphoesterase
LLAVDQLREIAPVDAVAGNNDDAALTDRFGTVRRLVVGAFTIGLTHGHLGRGRTTPERAESLFAAEPVDLIVFGHSHRPLWRPPTAGRPGLINPGSPTDRRAEPAFSYALITLGRTIEARIVRFGDRSI